MRGPVGTALGGGAGGGARGGAWEVAQGAGEAVRGGGAGGGVSAQGQCARGFPASRWLPLVLGVMGAGAFPFSGAVPRILCLPGAKSQWPLGVYHGRPVFACVGGDESCTSQTFRRARVHNGE